MITRRALLPAPLALLAPAAFAATPPLAIVMNSGEASCSVIDMTRRQVVQTLPTYREPSHWALSPDRSKLYVCDASGNACFVFDPRTAAPLGHIRMADPYQLAYTPDQKFLVVNALRLDHVDVYDAQSFALVHRFKPGKMPSHLDFSPDSAWSFNSMQGTDTLVSFDLRDFSTRWTVKVGTTPAGVLWHRGKILVAIMGEDGIVEVDPKDGHITRRQATGDGAHNIFYDEERDVLYVSNRGPGNTSLTALDPVSLQVIRDYPISGGPDDIGIDPEGNIWIALRYAEAVAVMDPNTGNFDTIPVGRSPHGIFLSTELQKKSELTAEVF